VRAPGSREELARVAAPAVFLVALTVLVLVVRSGLEGSPAAPPTVPVSTAAATTTAVTTAPPATVPKPSKRFYVIARGDTFGVVARKFNTTVESLQALNPGVSSNALTIGQKIRVK